MLDSIPPDAAFTQLLITQIVTYYDKCCGWYKCKKYPASFLELEDLSNVHGSIAMVLKASHRENERLLKAAAAFAESEDVRGIIMELWSGDGAQKQVYVDKVRSRTYI